MICNHGRSEDLQTAKASPRRGHGIASRESFPTAWARNRKLRKLPHGVGTELQAAKASPRRGHGIASRESFPTAWARNCKPRKLPHGVGTELQAAKASPRRGHGIRRNRRCRTNNFQFSIFNFQHFLFHPLVRFL